MSPFADFSPESAVGGGKIMFKRLPTFFNFQEKYDTPSGAKKTKRDGGGSIASQRSVAPYQFLNS
jgi:hypothetical protein